MTIETQDKEGMNTMSYVFWFTVLGIYGTTTASMFNRSSFPDGFLFGAASAAYQYEGADFEDGKGPSIWDTFSRQFPGKMSNRSIANIAVDFYHLYKEDVKLLKFLGFDTFRFSISWPRILPHGKLKGGVNKAGVAFYNNLINELISNGITPFVMIYHWDLPQALEDEYGGFLSPRIVDEYSDFAELCFKEFGDRVKHWMTFNEPYVVARNGYDQGFMAPGRCSACNPAGCPAGNSATEPYIVAHNILLAHAAAVKIYKQKYQKQKGEIGINLVTHWCVPYSSSKEDISARQRALDFMFGWFMHPLTHGYYPYSMRKYVQKRLPKFTREEKEMIIGSFDFIGVSYYTGVYVAHNASVQNKSCLSSSKDPLIQPTLDRNGKYIGDKTGFAIMRVYPKGLIDALSYIKEKYNSPSIYIMENGMADIKNSTTSEESINDAQRANFYHRHLVAIREAIKLGANVKGFFAWSFLDNFDWNSAFTLKFGLVYVDRNDGLKRHPKRSAFWFKRFLRID